MPLPTDLQSLLPPHMVELFNRQWEEMIQRQSVIRSLQSSIVDIRADLQHHDVSTARTPCYSELFGDTDNSSTFSDGSHTTSEISNDLSAFIPLKAHMGLSPGYTPQRHHFASSAFPWHAPPLHWSNCEQANFYTLKHSSYMRRLWRLYAATNKYRSWYAINSHTAHADIHAFMRECNNLSLHLYQIDTPHLRVGFTGGWADFFADSLCIRCYAGTSRLTVTRGAAFASASPVHFVFGGTLLSNSEFTQSIFRRGEHVLVRPEALSPQEKAERFALVENELLAPGTVQSCVFVLYQRESCRLTNAWLENFSTKAMVTTLASLNRFRLLHMTTKGKCPLLSAGAWELCAIHRAESTSSLFYDTYAVREALLRVTRHHRSNTTPSPFIFSKCLTVTERNRRLDTLWAEWDVLVDERKLLLSKRRVPWTKVDEKLGKKNLLLANSPCPRLSRISRLAQIPLGSLLRKAGIMIYVVVGRFHPYV